MDVVKCADWVIDMGPDAGETGGYCCFSGTPEEIARRDDLPTGRALSGKVSFPDVEQFHDSQSNNTSKKIG
jgi:excinuclease ABC subunit A